MFQNEKVSVISTNHEQQHYTFARGHNGQWQGYENNRKLVISICRVQMEDEQDFDVLYQEMGDYKKLLRIWPCPFSVAFSACSSSLCRIHSPNLL